MENKNSALGDYLPALEKEIGEVIETDEYAPGVYCIDARGEDGSMQEYYAVLDTSPTAEKVQAYGKKMDGFRLFSVEDNFSGWQIVQYEVNKHEVIARETSLSEAIFRDMSLHAMEAHPEYFGTFPVPFHTPYGYTLRYRTLSNGIYWLETSNGKELLAVCFPIWNAELSTAAAICGEMMERDSAGTARATPYRFFPDRLSCVPIYELMEMQREWEGTVIHLPALMNAIWENVPAYAISLNGQTLPEKKFILLRMCEAAGLVVVPEPDGKRIIGMYPEEGTDFLLLK